MSPRHSNAARIAVSPQEAADMLGCTRAHIHNQINAGTLRAHKLGERTFINIRDIYALVGEDAPASA